MIGEVQTIKEIAKSHGISNRELARRCGIPIRTVENWSSGKNTPPGYIIELIKEKLNATFLVYTADADEPDAPERMGIVELIKHLESRSISGGYVEDGEIHLYTFRPHEDPT